MRDDLNENELEFAKELIGIDNKASTQCLVVGNSSPSIASLINEVVKDTNVEIIMVDDPSFIVGLLESIEEDRTTEILKLHTFIQSSDIPIFKKKYKPHHAKKRRNYER